MWAGCPLTSCSTSDRCRPRLKEWEVTNALDVFASRANVQLKKFFWDLPCPKSSRVDFFKEPIKGDDVWLHLSRAVMRQVLSRMRTCGGLWHDLGANVTGGDLVRVEGTCISLATHATLAGKSMHQESSATTRMTLEGRRSKLYRRGIFNLRLQYVLISGRRRRDGRHRLFARGSSSTAAQRSTG